MATTSERTGSRATTSLSTVIGVFPTLDRAERAIDELRHAHFGYDRIRLVERGTGSFLDTLKGMFTGQAAVASNTADSLIKMGMPEYEAQHYQSELDAHHILVMMNADERPEDAFNVMRQSGAFDITSRLRMTPPDDTTESDMSRRSQEPVDATEMDMRRRSQEEKDATEMDMRRRSQEMPESETSSANTPPVLSHADVPPATSNTDASQTRNSSRNP